jgi:alpha/beta superfamily hydrolase
MEDYRAALDYMASQYPGLELWAAGFSFGSHIATTVGADDERICALIAIAPPVDKYEYASLKMSRKPKFIIHGERDEHIPLRLVRELYARLLEPKELVVIDGADHLFDGHVSEVGDTLVDLLEDFSCRKQSS